MPGHTVQAQKNDDSPQSELVFALAKEESDNLCQLLNSRPAEYMLLMRQMSNSMRNYSECY